MTTMNISLPDSLKSFVDTQVTDHDRRQLRDLLLQGASSTPGEVVCGAYFDALHQRVARKVKADGKV